MEAIFLATQQYPEIDWLGGKFPYTMTYVPINNRHKAVTIGFFFTDNMFRTLTSQVRWQG